MPFANTLEMIGNTPLVEVTCFDTGISRLFLKLENQNPGGSIKDRIGLSMIEVAEREGKIRPGDTLIEATAGNTGLGLALVASKKGYRLLLVIPDKMSQEKIMHLKALGAEIILTRSDVEKGHPEYYQDYAARLAKEIPNSFFVDQFNNPANPFAHETTTGPEIWDQMSHNVDAIAVGVGSGGTIAGLTRFFKKAKPSLEIILADPVGSILKDYIQTGKIGTAGSWLVEGIGEDFIPAQCDFDLVKAAYSISDEESFETARTLLKKEGILAGSSSGTLIAAAVRYAKSQKISKNVVTFVCDSGNKYLSKMYNDYWMIDNGFIRKESYGTILDLTTRKYSEREVVTVKKDDTILTAYSRMKLYDISQLPVLENGQIIGIIDESDILLLATESKDGAFQSKVESCMTRDLEYLSPDSSIESVLSILKKGMVVIVKDHKTFYGLITRIDFLNYLRRKLSI
ncbi:pyridoxal-phosphate dependent enzyme [Leptospira sp. WS92.C1]